MLKKTALFIVGPTAVGKTAQAIRVAELFNTEIISADSRQCFRELHIGVAKPSPEQLKQVRHHFINSHSIHDEVNTAVYEQYALEKLKTVFSSRDIAVVTGGTGLYVKTLCQGIDEVPVVDPSIRQRITETYEWEGLNWLQREVERLDPLYFSRGEIQNPQRLMRALEVKLSTGRSIIEFHTQPKKKRDFDIITIGLELPREQLNKQINRRVDDMMRQGLLAEVKKLEAFKKLNALQTVGYRELFGHLAGDLSLDEAVEIIKINTRQYAKRQMTWFKKDEAVNWVAPDLDAIKEVLQNYDLT
ncbi:MAG: tRNA (adenosine(37)-N6)-dimethylallyltransferase MiaA [Chitinophagaceae bacterium]|nr:tRNA (adenosine(37)-N6)-dimethylallyltransferase MiaA [Chitinophagaceae bacterium]